MKCIFFEYRDWREIRGFGTSWLDIPVNIDSICENFRSRKCAVLLFYIMIDAISSLSHTHLFFCDKEGMMIWECKHAE